jgi:hypothetical protein
MTKTQIADELDRIKQMVEALDAALSKLAISVEKDEAAEAATPAPPKRETPVTSEEVRAALTQLASTKGSDAAKKLLADYGAKKLTDMAAQDYPELLAAAERLTHA